MPGRKHRKTPACNGPVSMRDVEAPTRDAQRLKDAAKEERRRDRPVHQRSVTGRDDLLCFRNDYYPNQEEYVFAVAEALRHEYEAIVNAGIMLQIDCPDLAMGRHTQYADRDLGVSARRWSCTSRRSIARS